MEYATVYLILAALFGLFMAWGIGANDVANAMATSIGAKVLTLRWALVVAAIFEFSGAVLAGGSVTETIRKGIFDTSAVSGSPEIIVLGMLAALLAAGTWLLVATSLGWPVSTTHSIVGAIVGFVCTGIGISAVNWAEVGGIAISWVISPILAGSVAWLLFTSVQRLILDRSDPVKQARRYVPMYIFLAGFFISAMTLIKGLKHQDLPLSELQCYALAAAIGVVLAALGAWFISRIKVSEGSSRLDRYVAVERIFGVLMVFTACSMAFSHGSNDVANAIGPVAAIISIVNTGLITGHSEIPFWLLLAGGAGIVFGLGTFGRYVIRTVGSNITHLTPSRGFAAELAAASTVIVASSAGMPISTTHTLVGAVMGVGLARGIAALDLGVIRSIFMSWVITLPAGAAFATLFFYILRAIFISP